MTRRAHVLTLTLLLALVAAPASAHQGRPGFRSEVDSVTPRTPGLSVRVRGGDDRLSMVNHSGRTIEVVGTDGERYVQLRADGTVAVNVRSLSFYLDAGGASAGAVPANATAAATPRWQVVEHDSSYEWHDRRIHAAHAGAWQVPLRVDDAPGLIAGTLRSTGGGGGVTALAFFAPVGLLFLCLVFLARRRPREAGEPMVDEAW